MTAALRCWDRIAIRADETILVFRPMNGPLDLADLVLRGDTAREGRRRDGGSCANCLGQEIRQAAGEMQNGGFSFAPATRRGSQDQRISTPRYK